MFPIREILTAFQLGTLLEKPTRIRGRLTHKVWQIKTTEGVFAIKALNLLVLQLLKDTLLSVSVSESIAAQMKQQKIPALLALESPSGVLWKEKYMAFPWVEGRTLSLKEISLDEIFQIGQILKQIHNVPIEGWKTLPAPNWVGLNEQMWKKFIRETLEKQLTWGSLLESYLEKLIRWSQLADQAQPLLRESLVVGHRDLDAKNIIWHPKSFTLIDWEYVGLTYAQVDLLAVAMNWAGIVEGVIDPDRYRMILEGYGEKLETNKAVIGGYLGYCMDWLIFNLRYGLFLSPHDDRIHREVQSTLRAMDLAERFFII